MLQSLDLTLSLSQEDYREQIDPLRERLRDLQRDLIDSRRPVILLFEGMSGTGKSDNIRQVVGPLDPHGFKVHLTRLQMTEEERMRPPLWRFWMRIPGTGEIGIFDKGWYQPFIVQRLNEEISDAAWSERKDEIKQFERQLVDEGTILLKFWMHIDQKEQKKRFKTMVRNPYEGWRITKDDWRLNKKHGEYTAIADEVLVETDTPYAPWTLVASTDKRHSRVHVMRTIVETLERSLQEGKRQVTYVCAIPSNAELRKKDHPTVLDRADLSLTLGEEEYREQLDKYQQRLLELELSCYAQRLPVVVVYEGWDAAGKGGNIKRVTEKLDPHGYNVIPIAKPEGEEASHHYLWRFWRHLPKAGHISIFDRSWYGRVMVERVEGFCAEEEWKRAFYEINEFERHLADFGTVIAKFWVHISKEEQLRRFKEREETPHKQYKLTEEDWRNREKWDIYAQAVSEMIERTSTQYAPWTIIEGNDKRWARVKALRTLVEAIEGKIG